MARSGFTIVMWGAPERAPATAWAPRVAGVLGALEEHAGVSRFVRYERRVPHAVASDEQSVLAFLRSHPPSVDDAGVAHPDVGIETGLIGFDEREDEEPLCQVSIHVGDQRSQNNLSAHFYPHVDPQAPFEAFPGCVRAFSPRWACVKSIPNDRRRADEFEESLPPGVREMMRIDRMLHWRNYFGPERAGELDPGAVAGREEVIVGPLHEGVQVVLGERWESDAVLYERQRELEPLLLGERTTAR